MRKDFHQFTISNFSNGIDFIFWNFTLKNIYRPHLKLLNFMLI